MVVTTTHTTVENKWFGVPAGLEVNLTWVYLSRASTWEAALPNDTRKFVLPAADPDDPSVTPSSGPFEKCVRPGACERVHRPASERVSKLVAGSLCACVCLLVPSLPCPHCCLLLCPLAGPTNSFPHFSTFTQLQLTAQQANLLADLSGWVIQQNKDVLAAALSPRW